MAVEEGFDESVAGWDDALASDMAEALRRRADGAGADGRKPRVVTVAEQRRRPQPDWLVENRVPERAVGLVYGPSGAGKSFVTLDLLMRVANDNERWMGAPVMKHGPVLYVVMEGGGGFVKRIDGWLAAHPGATDDNLYLMVEEELNLINDASVQKLSDDLRLVGVDPLLVAIDTHAQATAGADENSTQYMSKAGANMKWLSGEHGSTVVAVHHTGWTATDRPRGASAIHAALDFEYAVTAGRIDCTKLRDGNKDDVSPWRFQLLPSGPSAWAGRGNVVTGWLARRKQVAAKLRDNPGRWPKTTLAHQCGGAYPDMLPEIEAMTESGLIVVAGGKLSLAEE